MRHAALFDVSTDGVVRELESLGRIADADIAATCERLAAQPIGPREAIEAAPHARGVASLLESVIAAGPVSLDHWEPAYGRLAEAQVKWEAAHGRALPVDDA